MRAHVKHLAFLFFLPAISRNNHSAQNHKIIDTVVSGMVDTAYMRTGFYYLAESPDGIRMRQEHSNEIFSIAKSPFASVDHISRTELDRHNYNGTNTITLCMIFDAEGTKDLKDGTGNSLHPKIAAIIADRLLYVVDNSTRIYKGIMCLVVDDYSEQEIAGMQKAIEQKK